MDTPQSQTGPKRDYEPGSLPFASILYEEYFPKTYAGIEVTWPDGRLEIFGGKNFEDDLCLFHSAVDDAGFERFLPSSSFDNFLADLRLANRGVN